MSKLPNSGNSTAFSGEITAPLTQEGLQEIYDLLYPPLKYATTNLVDRGVFYFIKETEFSPEFIVCHSEDLETIKSKTRRKLVPLTKIPYPRGVVDYNAHS